MTVSYRHSATYKYYHLRYIDQHKVGNNESNQESGE